MTAARPLPAEATAPPLLAVHDLSVDFVIEGMSFSAVNGVSFELSLGETLCLLGESGAGQDRGPCAP